MRRIQLSGQGLGNCRVNAVTASAVRLAINYSRDLVSRVPLLVGEKEGVRRGNIR